MLKTILLFSTKWQAGQAHLNRFRTIPAPPAPAARLRPSAPLRRVHTTPQAAARPAAGCPAAAHRLPGPDGRFERAQRKTRGSRQARRGTWPPPTPSAEVELNTARNGALTSRYGIERTETAFKRLVTPRKHRPGASSTRSCATSVTCRPAFVPPCLMDVIFGGVWGAAPTRRPGAERRAGGRVRWRSRMNPSSRGPPHPAQNRDFPAAWGCPKVGGG